ncbi:MAG TPA: hypothetical protein DEB18_06600, partial [Leeuwenhoekiella sp.]|nr:hypothetical protein [Leeuwenhoekiella sp.]
QLISGRDKAINKKAASKRLFYWHRQRVLHPEVCLEIKNLFPSNASWACPEVVYWHRQRV